MKPDLRQRIADAIWGALPSGADGTPIVEAVLRILDTISDEWGDASAAYYYAHRHTGPIDWAAGFEAGWDHAGALLQGHRDEPRSNNWREDMDLQ